LNPYDFFNELNSEIVAEIVERLYADEDELMDGELTAQVKALSDDALATGIEILLKKCTKPMLNDLHADFKENNYTKPIMVQKLMDVLFEKGIAGFFGDSIIDSSIVVNIASKFLGKKTEAENEKLSKEELIEKLEDETNLQGLTKFFEHFTISDLKSWCKKLKIKVSSQSKKRLAKAIIFGEDVGQTITRTSSGRIIEDKPAIDKTISKDDLMKYKVAELKKYCKVHDIKKTGNKSVLVDRITRFHNGEKVELESDSKKKVKIKKI